jgi:hypothetical protein
MIFLLYFLAVVPRLSIFVTADSIAVDPGVQVTDDSKNVNNINQEKTCSWETRDDCEDGFPYRDPNLKPMTVELEGEEDSIFYAYVDPDLSLAYNSSTPGSVKPKYTSFSGIYAKFINMSPETLQVHWEKTPGGTRSFMSELLPFACASTASYPSHRFVVVDKATNEDLVTWIVEKSQSLYYYDPYGSLDVAKSSLKTKSSDQYELYKMHYHTLEFNKQYEAFTGRQYLPEWKRNAPHLPIWPADSFGQTHVVTTRETHIESALPNDIADAKVAKTGATEDELSKLKPYRQDPDVDGPLQLNMTVISVMPRAFEIQNFFSAAEAEHILELATGMNLQTSSVGANSNSRTSSNVRTSRNSWIYRDRSVVVDVLHRRAADLLQINDALLRRRTADEQHLLPGRSGPIVEVSCCH